MFEGGGQLKVIAGPHFRVRQHTLSSKCIVMNTGELNDEGL